MVILERSDWSAWLEQTGNETELLRALPTGALKVEQVLAGIDLDTNGGVAEVNLVALPVLTSNDG
jgi:putative SOS response-associated peptidase YedK